jgi:hypothetical protein
MSEKFWWPRMPNKIEKSIKHNEKIAAKLTDEIVELSNKIADTTISPEEIKKLQAKKDKKVQERDEILKINHKIHIENPL